MRPFSLRSIYETTFAVAGGRGAGRCGAAGGGDGGKLRLYHPGLLPGTGGAVRG